MSEHMVIGATPEGTIVGFDPALFGHDVIETRDDFQEDAPREEEEQTVYKLRSGVMPIGHHRRYMANGGGCADVLDSTMRDLFTDPVEGVDRGALRATAEANGVWNPVWEHVNNGMLRMNLANRLRGLARRGTEIKLVDRDGELIETGTFGIQPTTLWKQQDAKAEAEQRKAETAKKQAAADVAREERAKAIEARKAANKPPVARIEQKVQPAKAAAKAKTVKRLAKELASKMA